MKLIDTRDVLNLIDDNDIHSLINMNRWNGYLNELWKEGNIDAIRYLRRNKVIKDIDLFELSCAHINVADLMNKSHKIIEFFSENALDGTLHIDDYEIIYKISYDNFMDYIKLWRSVGAVFDYNRMILECFRSGEKDEIELFNYLLNEDLFDAEGIAYATVSFLRSTSVFLENKNLMLLDMINRGLDLNFSFRESKSEDFDNIPVQLFCYFIDFYNQEQSQSIDLSCFEDCSWEEIVEFSCFDERHLKFVQRLVKNGFILDLEELKECLIDNDEEYFSSLI